MNIAGAGSLGSFSGTLDYTPGATGVLVVTLNNTSGGEGKLTGLLFNITGNATLTDVTASPSANWNWGVNENGAPFGTFDGGSWLGNGWEGGGNPNLGIHSGNAGSWTFEISGADASTLSAADFAGEAGGAVNFVVRFSGFDNGGSDKVPGYVPSPGTAALMTLGGMLAARRRR